MSMLAERKTKQKWCLNPRGKAWSQDSNKFGQKMLEKMGWQHGKGLGPNGGGITEHIKVPYKNDSKGMGYRESNDQWTEHEANFTNLLESLGGAVEKPDNIKLNSLEKKSQTSRARVHYQKFTRGKDLSRYSEKDLANIFGKKTLRESKKEIKMEEPSESNGDKNDSTFLLNAGSMRDYFKKKMPSFGKTNGLVVGSNGVLKQEGSESESEMRPSFGFGYKQDDDSEAINNHEVMSVQNSTEMSKSTFVSYINAEENAGFEKKKSKNKRKGEECKEDSVLSPKKKSKKNDEGTLNELRMQVDMGVSNPAFNPLYNPVKIQKHVLNTIQETVCEISESEENSPEIVEVEAEVYENADGTPKKRKERSQNLDEIVTKVCNSEEKKKSKKKKERGFVNDVVIEDIEETPKKKQSNVEFNQCTIVDENPYEVNIKEKKKKKKGSQLAINDQNVDNLTHSTGSSQNPYEVKVKEKKKKKKDEQFALDNPNFNVILESVINSSQVEEDSFDGKAKQKKKKKKNQQFALDNPNFNVTLESVINSSQVEEDPFDGKAKQKKKKKNEEQFALENPNFNVSLENSIDFSQIVENPYEVRNKKKRAKEGKFALENPTFNESVENATDSAQVQDNPYEVRVKDKKKKAKRNKIISSGSTESSTDSLEVEEVSYEVKDKKKKKKKNKEIFAVDNPHFDPNDSVEADTKNNVLEVERKKKKTKTSMEAVGIDNLALNLETSSDGKEGISVEIEESDIMLNVVTTPIITKSKPPNEENTYSIKKVNSVKRTKSVRFSDVTQERIIPNNDDLRNMSEDENGYEGRINNIDVSPLNNFNSDEIQSKRSRKRKLGLENAAFDEQKNALEENLVSISKTIDTYQAEIENDINEKKLEAFEMEDIMVGEVGNPHGEHERLPEGVKLKFKYADFRTKTPFYQLDRMGAKKSYKHLIKGDIVVKFKNANLHEIDGYAIKRKSTV